MGTVHNRYGKKPTPALTATPTLTNYAGAPAFDRGLRERYVQALLMNTLGDTFYATANTNADVAEGLHKEIAVKDPEFMAKALVYARKHGYMRTQPVMGLVALSATSPHLFALVAPQVLLIPDDVIDFVTIAKSGTFRAGLGRGVKEVLGRWLNGMTEYHALKYGSVQGEGIKLRDVLRLVRPVPAHDLAAALFAYLVDRKKFAERYRPEDQNQITPLIARVAELRQTTSPEAQVDLVAACRLPYEVVTGVVKHPSAALWAALIPGMGYTALLRHLNTFQKAGVLEDWAYAGALVERLGNIEAMRKAKVLPFRLYTALTAFTPTTPPEVALAQALVRTLDASFAALPTIQGTVVVAPDVSGSMAGKLNKESKVSYLDIAGVFAAALLRTNPQASLLPFDTQVRLNTISGHQSVLSITEQLHKFCGGGTAVGAPISHLLHNKIHADVVIGITDNESWARDGWGGTSFISVWRQYRKAVNPKARAYLLTIAPYGHAVAPAKEPGVTYIYGWSDQIPGLIAQKEAGGDDQKSLIEQVNLGVPF